MLHPRKIIALASLCLVMAACSEGDDPYTAEELRQDIANNIWLNPSCWIDFESNTLRESEAIIFDSNGTYEYHLTTYSATDTNCSGEPIGRVIETGTYTIGNQIVNSDPPGAFEIDLTITDVQVEGDTILMHSSNYIEPSLPITYYEVIAYIDLNLQLQLSFDFVTNRASRGNATEAVFNSIGNFAPNYYSYQTPGNYQAPFAAELDGFWQGHCYQPDGSIRFAEKSYNFTPPGAGDGTITYRIALYSDETCQTEIADVEYYGTYTVAIDLIALPAPWNISASEVQMVFDDSTTTGDANSYPTELELARSDNFPSPSYKVENMVVDFDRSLLLESNGSGGLNEAAPLDLEIIFVQ